MWVSGRTFQKEGTARLKALRSSRNSREARVAGAGSKEMRRWETGQKGRGPGHCDDSAVLSKMGKPRPALTRAGCAVLKGSWI